MDPRFPTISDYKLFTLVYQVRRGIFAEYDRAVLESGSDIRSDLWFYNGRPDPDAWQTENGVTLEYLEDGSPLLFTPWGPIEIFQKFFADIDPNHTVKARVLKEFGARTFYMPRKGEDAYILTHLKSGIPLPAYERRYAFPDPEELINAWLTLQRRFESSPEYLELT